MNGSFFFFYFLSRGLWILSFFEEDHGVAGLFVNGLEIVYQTVRLEIYAGPNSRKPVFASCVPKIFKDGTFLKVYSMTFLGFERPFF